MLNLNKLVGINYQITKTKSLELLNKLSKAIKHSIYDIKDVDMPDKDKLYNQLNTISTWDLVYFVYIKLLFKFTYKCQYYCMSDADKIARHAYLRSARKYSSVMSAKKLFDMDESTIKALIFKLKCSTSGIFFNDNTPYIISDNVRYNLYDKINILETANTKNLGKYRTLGQEVITLYGVSSSDNFLEETELPINIHKTDNIGYSNNSRYV